MVTFSNAKSPAEVLVDLWLATRTLGMGLLRPYLEPSVADAEKEIHLNKHVDYFRGRRIKVDFDTFPHLDSFLYDIDAGAGTMAEVAQNPAYNYMLTEKLNQLNI